MQEPLGHTSILLTAGTYTSVMLDLHFTTAEALMLPPTDPPVRPP